MALIIWTCIMCSQYMISSNEVDRNNVAKDFYESIVCLKGHEVIKLRLINNSIHDEFYDIIDM
jgi:hypothetical protein